jgi:hypothetical protein
MKSLRNLALPLVAVGALVAGGSAQEPPPRVIPAPRAEGPGGLPGFAIFGDLGRFPPFQWQSKAAQLAREYAKTEKESEKKEIREKLTEILNQQFDEHMRHQQKELEDLEKQIADLRTVMKKRIRAKAAIVDRRIEQLIQDAEGLGWNSPGAPSAEPFLLRDPDTFHPDSFHRGKASPKNPDESSPKKDRVKTDDQGRKKDATKGDDFDRNKDRDRRDDPKKEDESGRSKDRE